MKIAIWFIRVTCMVSFVISVLIIISAEYADDINIALSFYCVIVILCFSYSFSLEREHDELNEDLKLYSNEIIRLKELNSVKREISHTHK